MCNIINTFYFDKVQPCSFFVINTSKDKDDEIYYCDCHQGNLNSEDVTDDENEDDDVKFN